MMNIFVFPDFSNLGKNIKDAADKLARDIATLKRNKEYNDTWCEGRTSGLTTFGGVRCTYAPIYTALDDGKFKRVFSLQADHFHNEAIIEDCGYLEFDAAQAEKVFGVIPYIDVEKYFDPSTLHIGKLTKDAYDYITSCESVVLHSRYVMYCPKFFKWTVTKEKAGTNSNKKLAAIAMAAGAMLLN